ncbi:sensor histidine kinase [Cohnella thailandensis]|uniref:histidine kinase n=1 Tax=Cohnella thailandensis TaxID=557557 RepID=A0A841SY17_9BACL|nr:sensor histidine kinase [Cohnella thailandensis]MBB6636804.1 sensor histidine kinase [Cohnella thailandensis]MBP1973319.1 two-component system sensor histidine kinase YesM [Cohnella thailandensis]
MIRRRSLQAILSAAFAAFAVFMIAIVSLALYGRFTETAKENAYRNSQQIIDQVSYNLEIYIQGISDVFGMMHHAIGRSGGAESPALLEQLDAMMSTRADIVSVALFDDAGRLQLDLPNVDLKPSLRITEESWYRSALDTPGHLKISLPHVQNLYLRQYRWVVSLSKSISFVKNGKPTNGVLLMDVNFNRIDELSNRVSLGKKGYIYLLDESAGNIVYHPQLQLIYAGLKQENVELALRNTYGSAIDRTGEEERLVSVQSIGNVGWKVVGVSYLSEALTTSSALNRSMVQLIAAVVIIIALLSGLLSRRISRPIKRLEASMRSVERGEFDTVANEEGPLEIKSLADRFNLMIRTIKGLMEQIVAEQESKRKHELEALQAQINPHFLYNTLNTVVRMVGKNKNEEVVTTITSLSKLFRISIGKGKSLIPIADELEHARHYLIIQQVRFKNKFDFSFDVREDILTHLTLKLILQPLIENSIVHGIEPSIDKGHIAVSAKLENGDIVMVVEDNGIGMTEERLKLVNAGIATSSKGSGVGVRNVQERIRLYFGQAYGLSFESEPEAGTKVTARFPAILEEQGQRKGESHE